MGCASYHHLASEHERLSQRLHQIFKEKESVYEDKILLETEVAQLKRNFHDAVNQSETMKKEIDLYQSREYPEIFESSNVGTDEVSEWLEMDLRDGDRLLEVLMEVYPPATQEIKKLQAISTKMSREYSSLGDYLNYFHRRYALFNSTWKDIVAAQRIVDASMKHLKEDLASSIQSLETFLGKRSDALTDLQSEFRRITALPSFQFAAEQRNLKKKLTAHRAEMLKHQLEEKDAEKQRVIHLFEGEIKRLQQRHQSELDTLKNSKGGLTSAIRSDLEKEYLSRLHPFQTQINTLHERIHMLSEELLAGTVRLQAEKEEIQTVLTDEIEQRVAETKQMKDLVKHEKAILMLKQTEEIAQVKKESELLRRELQTTAVAHREEMERLKKQHQEDEEMLKKRKGADMEDRDLVLSQLKADFLAKSDSLKGIYEEKITAEREKHRSEMHSLEEEIADLVKKLSQKDVLWKDQEALLNGLIDGLAAKVELMDVEAAAVINSHTHHSPSLPAPSHLRERLKSSKELLWKLPENSLLRDNLERIFTFPLNSVQSAMDGIASISSSLETDALRSSVDSLKQQLIEAKRVEREIRDSQATEIAQKQEQSVILQRYMEDLSHRDAKIRDLAEGKRVLETERENMEKEMKLRFMLTRLGAYAGSVKRKAVYQWRMQDQGRKQTPGSHVRTGSAPLKSLIKRSLSIEVNAAVEQVFAEEKRQLFDTSSLGGLFRAVSRTEAPLLSQQTFKLMEDILERKYESDLSAMLRHSRPKSVAAFALEHLRRTIGNEKMAQKTLGQALICLLRHMREGQPYAELFCKLLNIGVSDPISLELGVFIVKSRADFTKFSDNYYRELPDKRGSTDLEGGSAFLVDIISYLYDLFERDPKSGELALKLIKPPEIPIEQYVMFKICHKMAKTGVNAEGTFELMDTNKTGVIEQEEFVESIRKVLELWISPDDLNDAFAELSSFQSVLRKRVFLEKLNFKQYLQDGLSEKFSMTRARFLNVLVEVNTIRERQIASELLSLFGPEMTISMREFTSVVSGLEPEIDPERIGWLWSKAEDLSAGNSVTTKSAVRTLLRHRVGEYAESPFCMVHPDEGHFDPSLQPLGDESQESGSSFTEAEMMREGSQTDRQFTTPLPTP